MDKLKRIIIIGVMVSNKRIILYRIIGREKSIIHQGLEPPMQCPSPIE